MAFLACFLIARLLAEIYLTSRGIALSPNCFYILWIFNIFLLMTMQCCRHNENRENFQGTHKQNASTHIFSFIIYILCIRRDIMRCRQFMGICKYLKEHCYDGVLFCDDAIKKNAFLIHISIAIFAHTCNVSTPATLFIRWKRRVWANTDGVGMDYIASMCI